MYTVSLLIYKISSNYQIPTKVKQDKYSLIKPYRVRDILDITVHFLDSSHLMHESVWTLTWDFVLEFTELVY